MRFAKGHGTGNDFVILPDPDGQLDLTPELVAALCDRHFGLGADGVLRVVRTAAAGPEAIAMTAAEAAASRPPAGWFMDYRNADGSVAEMCGNGVRVFARYLLAEGMARGSEVAIATRAGTRTVRAEPDGQLTVDMGGAKVVGTGSAEVSGRRMDGLAISVGNPHLACLVDEPVVAVDLTAPQVLGPAELTAGANVEIVRLLGPREIEMRVHERGSGLTLSCGTGAVAAAVLAAVAAGRWSPAQQWPVAGQRPAAERPAGEPAMRWTVHVPGGTLGVVPDSTASLLTGPAEIVASGAIADDWLAGIRSRPGTAARPGRAGLGLPEPARA